mmetsp:Transcript_71550/g.124263  ORF Transcript_71550/g.124263 Transcript_71550/m.124263 type:complete len:172 (-) Transcript_71550:189-704(-)
MASTGINTIQQRLGNYMDNWYPASVGRDEALLLELYDLQAPWQMPHGPAPAPAPVLEPVAGPVVTPPPDDGWFYTFVLLSQLLLVLVVLAKFCLFPARIVGSGIDEEEQRRLLAERHRLAAEQRRLLEEGRRKKIEQFQDSQQATSSYDDLQLGISSCEATGLAESGNSSG